MQLKDRVAVVTGAGQGIGASVAAAYAREGARVAVVDMNGEAAAKVAAAIVGAGGTAIGVACDVSNREQVEAMAAKVNAEWGRIDILVNNAGITRTAMLHKMTPEQWNQVIAVHLTGAMNCLQAVVGGMIERKYGRIIYVTSAAGVLGTIGQINYSAAKAGILGWPARQVSTGTTRCCSTATDRGRAHGARGAARLLPGQAGCRACWRPSATKRPIPRSSARWANSACSARPFPRPTAAPASTMSATA
jgi:NAD(P)-dependent dehydrogenase (short-subunit alcohol dehydrogenase family)